MATNFTDAQIGQQIKVCERLKVKFVASPADSVIAVSDPFDAGSDLIQGLRREATDKETGWHIWTGGDDPDDLGFFDLVPVRDFARLCPVAVPYLGLAPGWRFKIEPGNLKVWFDAALLRDRSNWSSD